MSATGRLQAVAAPSNFARSVTSAQFSGPFTVSTALLGGGGLGVSLDDFTDEAVKNAAKLDLASRVRCFADEECDRIFPNQFPAVLRVRLTSGDVREARISHNRGGPEKPLSDEELDVKFRTNAGRALPARQVEELRCALETLGEADTVGDVMRLAGTRDSVRSDWGHAGG